MIRPRSLFLGLSLLAPASVLFALGVGSVPIDVAELWDILTGQDAGIPSSLVLELRWPRALSAFAVGGMLALAGVLMQVLLRNPLADPYVLGVSGGAATAALLAMLAGISGWGLTATAFTGALLSVGLVFGLARGYGSWTPTRLLLTGVVIAFGWSAVISFVLAIATAQHLRSMLFWLMGDLSHPGNPLVGMIVLALGLGLSLVRARDLNVMIRGELQAAALGVELGTQRIGIYLLASLLTAVAVTIAGSIGFIGLVVPHLLRLIAGSDHRILLPAAVLGGGSLLVVADTLARSVLAPQQLPVGVLTALLGVPLFLYLLHRGRF